MLTLPLSDHDERRSHPPSTASCLTLMFFLVVMGLRSQDFTRGIGVYPGDPKEDFSPSMKIDSQTYRNLALHRPAYQSSAYDFNLTSQLVTDGIKESDLPSWIVVTTSDGATVPRNERSWIIDRNPMTRKTVSGSSAWIQIEQAGKDVGIDADSAFITGNLLVDSLPPARWSIAISGGNDGKSWKDLGELHGEGLPGETLTGWWRMISPRNMRTFNCPIKFSEPSEFKLYRLSLNSPNVESWSVGEFGLTKKGKRATVGGPYGFSSSWMSGGSGEEWVYVDLGAVCGFDRIILTWIQKASTGSVQVSDDAKRWNTILPLPGGSDVVDDLKLGRTVEARYVRVLMTGTLSDHYILSEMEVYGRGGPAPFPHPEGDQTGGSTISLAGGDWKVQRASLVHADGVRLSKPGFRDDDWLIATVPGTVLVSYLNAGALPDPNFNDNQLLISDSYFYSDFWYRDEFTPPRNLVGRKTFLNFGGINWKAQVFLNGHSLGSIEGAFTRKQFDVSRYLLPGKRNALAVLIRKNDTPGFAKEQTKLSHDVNGGELGSDNPTFHASVGWDWIPTIRGRNTGIWGKVFLSTSGDVCLKDPFVSSTLPLPDTTSAEVSVEVTLVNQVARKVRGLLRGTIGSMSFEDPIALNPSETKKVRLDPSTIPALRLKDPLLWWPNGYGQQNLYRFSLAFVSESGRTSDSTSFNVGIRQMTYSEDGGALRIWVNGRRLVGRGGNWGFPESMLRYRGREYDAAVRYHKEMNFTMIRNWVGQTGDDEFYDACDRYGIMVWQDFWLANPFDGPDPNDDGMFIRNADDFVKRIRNHPSIGLYCGRNEGNPPQRIDSALASIVKDEHPWLHYISNSASGVVSGGGPYRAMPVKFYFENRATEKLHSEIGMPNMVSYESLRRMIPDSALWPINRLWGVHDFSLESAQYGKSFIELMENEFGPVDSLRDWLDLAQWINYDGYRGMFEAQSKNRMGILLWMSHPAWPSMVWQTYDYFFEPTAAYFGCKKACEPLHVQWNPLTDSVEVVNYSVQNGSGLLVKLQAFNIDGSKVLDRSATLDCPEDRTVDAMKLSFPDTLAGVSMLRLTLMRGTQLISENTYWHGEHGGALTPLRSLQPASVTAVTEVERSGGILRLKTDLSNTSSHIAPMVKLKVVGKSTGERILPVIFSDNYISLLPGEHQTVTVEVRQEDTRGEEPDVVVEGYHLKEAAREY